MRVAVTGAAGLIGGVVCDRLAAEGHEVIGIDRPFDEWMVAGRNTEDTTAPSRVTHHFDLAEATNSDWEMMFEDCEVVVHLAADANPSNSDESMMRNNVLVSTKLMQHAQASGARRVVLSSSGLVQVGLEDELKSGGILEGQLIGVKHGISTTSTYGETKVFVEELGEHYSREQGMECIAVRIGTVIPNEDEHWVRGGRLQATAFLQQDVANFFVAAVEANYSSWDSNSCEGHPDVAGYLLTAAQSNSPGRFIDLEPGITALGWNPISWPSGPENLQ
ncbi:MAG: NAD(P)-dependent oxidoreductase [Euryarchaeota archaeon]|jgi:nucleoside-diphosphate-sugar epimerase|nr:NAD(P)-dependent oxidoreductase [Euryarchaeota archaeon]